MWDTKTEGICFTTAITVIHDTLSCDKLLHLKIQLVYHILTFTANTWPVSISWMKLRMREFNRVKTHNIHKVKPRDSRVMVMVVVVVMGTCTRISKYMFAVQQSLAWSYLCDGFGTIVSAMTETRERTMIHWVDVLCVCYSRHWVIIPIQITRFYSRFKSCENFHVDFEGTTFVNTRVGTYGRITSTLANFFHDLKMPGSKLVM